MRHLLTRAISIAIDLGSANTLIYREGAGIIVNEPTVVALRAAGGEARVVAVGREAARMAGRTGPGLRVVWPVRDGMVADSGAATAMLKALLLRALGGAPRLRRVLISVPCDASPVERAAFLESARWLGARDVRLAYEPVAAAIGAGLDVLRPRGRLVVDVGSGITEAVVISMGQVVSCHSVRKGGDALDRRLIDYVRGACGLCISQEMAEHLKLAVSPTLLALGQERVSVRGQWLERRTPGMALVSRNELRPIFTALLDVVVACALGALGQADPELVRDISEEGVWLSGGSLLMAGMEAELASRLGVAVHRVPDPLAAVALGNGRLLEGAYTDAMKGSPDLTFAPMPPYTDW